MKSFNLTRYSVTHPIGIFMIVLFFVVLGLYSYWRIGVELYPNINVPYVIVSVRYDGADAESVEQQITKPLEDALSSVSNVKHITSKSRTGRSDVTLELNFDADADAAAIISDISIIQWPCSLRYTLSSSSLRRSSENHSSFTASNRKKVDFPAP